MLSVDTCFRSTNKPQHKDKRSVIFLSKLSTERFLIRNKPGVGWNAVGWSAVAFSVVQAYVASALLGEEEGGGGWGGVEFHIHSQLEMMILPLAPSPLSSVIFQRGKQRRKNKKEKGKKHQSMLLSTSKLEAF